MVVLTKLQVVCNNQKLNMYIDAARADLVSAKQYINLVAKPMSRPNGRSLL